MKDFYRRNAVRILMMISNNLAMFEGRVNVFTSFRPLFHCRAETACRDTVQCSTISQLRNIECQYFLA